MPRWKIKPESVMGHTLPEPSVTLTAVWLVLWRMLLPVLVIGSLLDLAAQWLFGVCTGLWCFVDESGQQ